ncbi:substrate-binding domain-containing protein [Mameliella sp.]|uniref:substrate-binding domain-containing protein n=1 Tax=Mameliella sp. TaxID=1924940 RepID=UPI003B50E61C
MAMTSAKGRWKGPTVEETAKLAGVGTASVDRVLNNRPGVKEKTRTRVLAAFDKLKHEQGEAATSLRIRLLCDSGESSNAMVELAVDRVNRSVTGIEIDGHYDSTNEMDPLPFASNIEDAAEADGVIVIAREHPAINRTIRKLLGSGQPVVTLTTDLPSSRRSAYIGNDQYAAGSVAAQLIGQILPEKRNSILLTLSVSFTTRTRNGVSTRAALRVPAP